MTLLKLLPVSFNLLHHCFFPFIFVSMLFSSSKEEMPLTSSSSSSTFSHAWRMRDSLTSYLRGISLSAIKRHWPECFPRRTNDLVAPRGISLGGGGFNDLIDHKVTRGELTRLRRCWRQPLKMCFLKVWWAFIIASLTHKGSHSNILSTQHNLLYL